MPPTRATTLINQAIAALGYDGYTPAQLYAQIGPILDYLNTQVHALSPISIGTTGTILEQLCRFGLDAAVAGTTATVHRMPQQWKWVGDFSISGDPFNLVVSCKSFKARERLLASGSGSALSPTIGWGAFNDADRIHFREDYFVCLPWVRGGLHARDHTDRVNARGPQLYKHQWPSFYPGSRKHGG